MNTFLSDPDDVQWLKDTCLKGITTIDFKSALLTGNEDSPDRLKLYLSEDPNFDDEYQEIDFTLWQTDTTHFPN